MSDKLKRLAGQALDEAIPYTWTTLNYEQIHELLACHADIVIKEAIDACRQEWYRVNNELAVEDDPRSVAIRVGTKAGLIMAMGSINKRLGIES
jgi:hypothetical protein